MPKTLSWRRIAWALAGAAALFGLKPAPAKADALVATFAACLEDQQPARRVVPQHVSPGHGARRGRGVCAVEAQERAAKALADLRNRKTVTTKASRAPLRAGLRLA